MKLFVSLLVYTYLLQPSLAQLYRSPLFGGSDTGVNFDDQVYSMTPKVIGFTQLLIRSSAPNDIKGIQATYEQEDGEIKTSAYHGGYGEVNTSIGIGRGMPIVRIEGELEGNTSQQYLTSLTLYVRYPESLNLGKYGPYGSPGSGKSLFGFAGEIVGLFGQSSQELNAIGFDIDTTPYSPVLGYYKKTSVAGVDIGKFFDDEIDSLSLVKITTMTIRYSKWIEGIETTYILRDGTSVVKGHGAFNPNSLKSFLHGKESDEGNTEAISEDAVIHFANNEWISRIDVSTEDGKGPINSLTIMTRNSEGLRKAYGPFGALLGSEITVSIDGTIAGFYGYENEKINALGFYF